MIAGNVSGEGMQNAELCLSVSELQPLFTKSYTEYHPNLLPEPLVCLSFSNGFWCNAIFFGTAQFIFR